MAVQLQRGGVITVKPGNLRMHEERAQREQVRAAPRRDQDTGVSSGGAFYTFGEAPRDPAELVKYSEASR